jgi:hypothetical protein
MSSSQALYTQAHAKLHALHPTLHLKRLAVWVWVVVGLIHSQTIHLSEIANHIPGDADAAGRIMRVRRWLASRWIVSRDLYRPIITEVLEPGCQRRYTFDSFGCLVIASFWYRTILLARAVVTNRASRAHTSGASASSSD